MPSDRTVIHKHHNTHYTYCGYDTHSKVTTTDDKRVDCENCHTAMVAHVRWSKLLIAKGYAQYAE